MANADVDVELNSTNVNHLTSFNEEKIHPKSCDLIEERNDSRVTDPDGAQSPASSTYADCEDQNDNSLSENIVSQNKETSEPPLLDTDHSSISKPESDDKETSNSEINNNSNCDDSKHCSKPNNEESSENRKSESVDDNIELVESEKYQEISDNDVDYVDEDGENFEDISEYDTDQHEEDRENGDGQEGNEDEDAASEKELDDDEDRRNPQYIPKRGFFYEHDDRTEAASSDEEVPEDQKKEVEPKEPEPAKVKNRRPVPDGKWQHDLYREEDQNPKSAQELIDLYGYDIRNEESAPKARRRRKYGRGPNKYTRKWDDENAYSKQLPAKSFHGRKSSLKKEDYEEDFPSLDKKSKAEFKAERPPPRKSLPEVAKNEDKLRDVFISNSKSNNSFQERPRNFQKRLPGSAKEPRVYEAENFEPVELRYQKTIRNSQFSSSDTSGRFRGRGIGHGKITRALTYEQGSHLQFPPGNRGRAKRLVKPSHQYYPKHVSEAEVQELSEQMSTTDLGSKNRISIDKQYGDSEHPNEQSDLTGINAVTNVRSKRYSHQRQRLLPEVNKVNSTNLMHQNMQPITHTVQNVQNVQNVVAAPGLCQSLAPTHTSMPLMSQNQCAPQPSQNAAAPLSVPPTSIPSSSLAVSGSLIPLSAPPLTASGPALSAGAPPLPIMGFFQHPQGFTNQPAPTQLYTREQTVMGGPSNQSVQLVAFLPASPILSNTNHPQSAPSPPPPPPPPGFPTTVMNYQQTTQAPPNPSSFNSESYSIPPVTLAPIHQPPEMYQSRGGVTYYNTRSQVKPRSPPPPRVKTAIPIVPPPSCESLK